MRPIKLEMENFGPYREKAQIRFDALGEFFLICGKTGSGKSTIFDAITYALFGAAPGARGGLEAELVSDFAAPGEKPRVEFEFSLSGVKYKAARVPPFSRPKRGGGLVEVKQEAALYVEKDGVWTALKSGVRDVNEAVEKLIGLSADEFSRIILLPQGEFQRFLEMESSKRGEVLEKIFPVDLNEKISELAKEKARRAQAELDSMNDSIARLDAEIGENASARASEVEEELKAAVEEEAAANFKVKALEESLRSEEERANRIFRAQEAAAKKAKLDARLEAETARGTRIERARAAVSVLPLIYSYETANSKNEEVLARVAGLAVELGNLKTRSGEIADSRKSLASRGVALGEIEVRLFSLEKSAEAWKRRIEAEAKEREARGRAEALLGEIDAEAKRRESILAELEKMRPAPQEALALRADLDTLQVGATRAASAADKIGRALALAEDLIKAEKAEAAQGAAFDFSRAAADEAARRTGELESATARSEAAHLALGLRPGEPCPVCGSREHPAPAAVRDEEGVAYLESLKELGGLRQRSVELEAEAAAARANLENSRTRQKELREALGRLEDGIDPKWREEFSLALPAFSSLDPQAFASKLREDRRAVESQGRTLESKALEKRTMLGAAEARARSAEIMARGYEKEVASRGANIELLRKRKEDAAREAVEAATVAAETRRAAGDEDPSLLWDAALSQKRKLENEKRILEDAIGDWEKALHTVEAKLDAARKESSLAAGSLLVEQKRLLDAVTSVAAGLGLPRGQKFELGEAVEAARAAALPPDTLAAEESAAARYREAVASASALAQSLSSDLPAEGEPRPDTRSLVEALAPARDTQTSARARTDSLRISLAKLVDQIARREKLASDRDRFEEGTRTLSALTTLLNGDVSGKRLPFKLYVLAGFFRNVVRRASIHLSLMSDGRYYLKPEEWQSTGRAKIGLGLRVLDSWTGLERPTATLSGGEKFLTSISLALGLSDSIRERNGGVSLDSVFIDEGFGSLDDESLDRAIDVLNRIRGSRTIGIISHVPSLKSRIPSVVEVEKTASGSRVQAAIASDQAL